MAEPLTPEHLATMEQAARRFSGAYTGTSGTLAGYVIHLLQEVQRLKVAAALKENETRVSCQ
jgi:vacuolar-type H+-ATPase subunit C/Vma6